MQRASFLIGVLAVVTAAAIVPARGDDSSVAVLPGPAAPSRCSVGVLRENPEGYHYPLEHVRRFVADAEVIVRAVALDSVARPRREPQTHLDVHLPPSGVTFRVVESLRGTVPDDPFVLPGALVPEDDFNDGPVPYRMVRRAGRRGDCYAMEYRRGAEYLLLMRTVSSGLLPHWAPLAPLNEQLRGPDDPWLRWVRTQLEDGVHEGPEGEGPE